MDIIKNVYELNAALKYGPYAWPGGYPLYFIAADGEPLSFDAVNENKAEVFAAFEPWGDPAWRPVACVINWEDEFLYCAHTGKQIESAYGDDEEIS